MQCEVRGMTDANPRVSDTLPRRGRVNEVCREWIVHEDEALAYRLQKQEVEQHYGQNKQRNALVREDFPKAKEEQEKEILEAAEKYRQMVRQQEKVDSTYARRFAEKLERDELQRRKQTEMLDQEVAKKMQAYEAIKNANEVADARLLPLNQPPSGPVLPDVNRVGLPLVRDARNFEPLCRPQPSVAITHSLRNLRLNEDKGNHVAKKVVETERSAVASTSTTTTAVVEPCTSQCVGNVRINRTPTPATLLPDDLNDIITDVELQEEANRRLQEEKDAELARMLQKQEEEIFHEEVDRDRLIAIEAQDKELAKLLYEKEKAKVRRAKERARQRALLKKQMQQQQTGDENNVANNENAVVESSNPSDDSMPPSLERRLNEDLCAIEVVEEIENSDERIHTSTLTGGRTSAPMMNVAMHIDPTYLSQQSSSMPNSLMFQDGDGTAPPYMPIQGQRRNTPGVEKKQKKSKSKDGCKQQ